ncbi:CBS domain-containing protein [Campylobacter coli]|nr:CBS domain-containing protein [Campylobacter coli]EAJ2845522.1 CBS domain-containing protein [Campylobacter coli]
MKYISKNITIKEALKLLSSYASIRLLVIGDKDKWGIVTDPDIRKALLNNMTLEDKIERIVNYNPIIAHCNDDKEKIIQLSAKYNIYQIPIVDDSGCIIRIENVLEDKTINKTNKIVIMAGGLGTRLRPLTENIPKPMLKVGNRPILEIIIKKFKKQGFTNFILCVNYKAEVIQNYFKDGKDFGVSISYVREDKRMGTAGALSLIEDVGEEPFFVTNGDILAEVDYDAMLEFHITNKSLATMGVRKHFYQIPYGVIVSNVENQILKIEEKPEQTFLVNSGFYILDPKILSYIPKNEFFDMPTLFENIQENDKYAYLIEDYWIDIGRHEEYEKARSDIAKLDL